MIVWGCCLSSNQPRKERCERDCPDDVSAWLHWAFIRCVAQESCNSGMDTKEEQEVEEEPGKGGYSLALKLIVSQFGIDFPCVSLILFVSKFCIVLAFVLIVSGLPIGARKRKCDSNKSNGHSLPSAPWHSKRRP